jgi:hypothetical protein
MTTTLLALPIGRTDSFTRAMVREAGGPSIGHGWGTSISNATPPRAYRDEIGNRDACVLVFVRHRKLTTSSRRTLLQTRKACSTRRDRMSSVWAKGKGPRLFAHRPQIWRNPGQTDWVSMGTQGNPRNTREPREHHLLHGNLTKTGGKTGTQGRPRGNPG